MCDQADLYTWHYNVVYVFAIYVTEFNQFQPVNHSISYPRKIKIWNLIRKNLHSFIEGEMLLHMVEIVATSSIIHFFPTG